MAADARKPRGAGGGMTGELRALTSARGVAAWLVVAYHLRTGMPWLPAPVLALFAKGYLAVDFFFLLSGFVIWLSWGEQLRVERWRAAPEFLRRRIARVWPLHLAMLAFAAALVTVFAVTGRDTNGFPIAELPLHVLLLQNWGFTATLTWNYPAWSISCELGAYLAFPLLAFSINWRRVPSWAVVTAACALLLLLAGLFARTEATSLGWNIAHMGLVRCLLEFASGTAVAALWLRWRQAPLVPASVAAALAATLLVATVAGLREIVGVPAAFAALLLALALTSGMRGNPLDHPLPHAIGEASYATYLSHFLLFLVFKLAFVAKPHAIPPGLVALYLALVLAASLALYHCVERPSQRWLNALPLPCRNPLPVRALQPHGSDHHRIS